ncbi:MAG TPA: hypothetical protein VLJ10_04675, partial [Candidatus Bathyarchaeia archaeon]|nr:hypothetical protein [Candidatus Bathyarchaeia archaeon]
NRADQIDLKRIPEAHQWSQLTISECDRLLENIRKRNRFYLLIDAIVGKWGRGIAERNRGMYHYLVWWKKKLKIDRLLHIGTHLNETPRFLKSLNDRTGD